MTDLRSHARPKPEFSREPLFFKKKKREKKREKRERQGFVLVGTNLMVGRAWQEQP